MKESQRQIDAGFIPTRQVSEIERSHPFREGPAPGALGLAPPSPEPSHSPTGMLVAHACSRAQAAVVWL